MVIFFFIRNLFLFSFLTKTNTNININTHTHTHTHTHTNKHKHTIDELPEQEKDDQPEVPEKGLLAMGFMKRAMERERIEAMDEEEREINFKQGKIEQKIFNLI